MKREQIIYSITVEDVQRIARQELGREVTDNELKLVEEKLGDQLDWFGAIATILEQHIETHENTRPTAR